MRVALLNPVFWPEVRRGVRALRARARPTGLLARGHAPRHHHRATAGAPRHARRGRGAGRRASGARPTARLRRRMFEEHLTHVPFAYARAAPRRRRRRPRAATRPTALVAARWARAAGRRSSPTWASRTAPALANRRRRVEIAGARCAARRRGRGAQPRPPRTASRAGSASSARVIRPAVDLDSVHARPGRAPTQPTIVCAADRGRAAQARAAAASRRSRACAASGPTRGWSCAAPRGAAALDARGRRVASTSTTAPRWPRAYREAWVSALPSLRRGVRARAGRGAGLRHAGRRRRPRRRSPRSSARRRGRAAVRRRRPGGARAARCSRRSSSPPTPRPPRAAAPAPRTSPSTAASTPTSTLYRELLT